MNKDKYIIESLQDLDLTPTMEKNAREKYKAISDYLNNNGLKSDFYPQGSFLLGTVVRPFSNEKHQDYDLDILVILDKNKAETTAKEVKNDVGNCIKESDLYKSKLEKEDRNCWTLKYADISPDVGFLLDLVPAVYEDLGNVNRIKSLGLSSQYTEQIVSITDKVDKDYEWICSNPLGFGNWFLDISKKHMSNTSKDRQFQNLSEELRSLYSKVEEVPYYYFRSNLQRAVQFVKRHRDIYYDRTFNNKKPSSMLLTSLIASSVEEEFSLDILEIIHIFIEKYRTKSISIMKDNKVLNPLDGEEDLISEFTEDDIKKMMSWIENLEKTINIEEENEFKRNLNKYINTSVFKDTLSGERNIEPIKPWRE